MRMTSDIPNAQPFFEAVFEGFVLCNMLLVVHGIVPPFPYGLGIRYQLEPPTEEDWKLAHNVVRDGWGDCEDVCLWAAAGYRVTGQDEKARVVVVRTGENKLHAVVEHGDGSIEDVSLNLLRERFGDGVHSL